MPSTTVDPTAGAGSALPTDLVLLIVQEALDDSWPETERQHLACTLSLVCRGLRDFGQGVLWRSLTIGGASSSHLAALKGAATTPRLGSLVRFLTWDGDSSKAAGKTATAEREQAEWWDRLVPACDQLDRAFLWSLGVKKSLQALSILGDATSAAQVTMLGIETNETNLVEPADEERVVHLLASFPSLEDLTCDILSPSPPTVPRALHPPTLSLECLSTYEASGAPFPLPSEQAGASSHPLPPLFTIAHPPRLTALLVAAVPGRCAALAWLQQSPFDNLSLLSLTVSSFPLQNLLPTISTILGRLPSLHHLQLHDDLGTWGETLEVSRPNDLALFRQLFLSFPPTLEKAEILYGFDLSPSSVTSYFLSVVPPSLQRIDIKRRVQTGDRARWAPEEWERRPQGEWAIMVDSDEDE